MSDLDLTTLTDEALADLSHEVTAERSRRWAVATAQERAAEVQEDAAHRLDEVASSFHGATGGVGTLDAPVPWTEPTGAHDAWPLGSVVRDAAGKVWESLVPANATPPSSSNRRWWREVTADPGDGPPAWDPGAYYRVGDVVERLGEVYTCTHEHQAAPGWEPENPTMHAVWRREEA